MNENYKEETRKAYDTFIDEFDIKFEDYLNKYLERNIKNSMKFLPKGSKLLDIGSGPGNHALLIKEIGYNVVCIDISEEMIKKCKEKGLNAMLMDLENLKFPDKSFDGVWGYTSLLHIPKKNFNNALKQIYRILKPLGILFLGMQEGKKEGFRIQDKYPKVKRWFSLYTDEELREYLKLYFEIEFYSRTEVDEDHIFLNYILKKK